jgi:hypothetical protein
MRFPRLAVLSCFALLLYALFLHVRTQAVSTKSPLRFDWHWKWSASRPRTLAVEAIFAVNGSAATVLGYTEGVDWAQFDQHQGPVGIQTHFPKEEAALQKQRQWRCDWGDGISTLPSVQLNPENMFHLRRYKYLYHVMIKLECKSPSGRSVNSLLLHDARSLIPWNRVSYAEELPYCFFTLFTRVYSAWNESLKQRLMAWVQWYHDQHKVDRIVIYITMNDSYFEELGLHGLSRRFPRLIFRTWGTFNQRSGGEELMYADFTTRYCSRSEWCGIIGNDEFAHFSNGTFRDNLVKLARISPSTAAWSLSLLNVEFCSAHTGYEWRSCPGIDWGKTKFLFRTAQLAQVTNHWPVFKDHRSRKESVGPSIGYLLHARGFLAPSVPGCPQNFTCHGRIVGTLQS